MALLFGCNFPQQNKLYIHRIEFHCLRHMYLLEHYTPLNKKALRCSLVGQQVGRLRHNLLYCHIRPRLIRNLLPAVDMF